MDRPRIALVLDNPQRDLAGLVLTAVELCQAGASCTLVPASLRAREIWALAPDYVLLYNFRRGFDRLVAQLGEARIGVGALDTEGGVWPQLSTYTELLIPDAALRRRARPLCAWGATVAEHLVREGLFGAEQVAVTGCPRFDLYHPAWRSVAGGGAAAAGPPRVLVNTNYSEGNPRFTDDAGTYRHLCEVFGWSRARAEELVATQRQGLDASIALVRALAADFPEARIVVRPHPFEGTAVYTTRLGGLPNVELNLAGPLVTELGHAVATIQRTSTTALESVLAGVPSLVPLWIPAVGGMPVVEAVSEPCPDYAALRAAVSAILAGRYARGDAHEAAVARTVREVFHEPDGQAHRRVSEAVLAALPDRRVVDEARCRRNLHGLDVRRAPIDAAARHVRRALGLSPDWSLRRFAEHRAGDWTASDAAYHAHDVHPVAERVLAARRAAGRAARPVVARQARDGGDYRARFHGDSVTLALAT